ncbi:MAG: hypothetical protein K0B02_04705 [DPANN group archaeon]|nr:hypothetical protein [DPANN group archaeon]
MSGIITFKHLRELQKNEKEFKQDLQPLDVALYKHLKNHIATIVKLSKKGSLKDQANLQHTLTVVRSIIDGRVRKIIESARLRLDGGSIPKNMLPDEKALFEVVEVAVAKYKMGLSDILYSEEPSESVEDTEESELDDNSLLKDSEKLDLSDDSVVEKVEETVSDDLVSVEILDEIPQFVGNDMKDYGPFSKGNEAKIPGATAEILIGAGKVREITDSD